MAMFHSYVQLPEGMPGKMINMVDTGGGSRIVAHELWISLISRQSDVIKRGSGTPIYIEVLLGKSHYRINLDALIQFYHCQL